MSAMSGERKRPRTWHMKPIYERPDSEAYAKAVIKREEELLLPWVNKFADVGEMYFATSRDIIGQMAWPYLYTFLTEKTTSRKVLEIGGGEGNALLFLLRELEKYPSLPSVFFTMTSLTHQPEQERVKEKGVELKIPQVAEALPAEWEGAFDIVMTCSLFGWVAMKETLAEIKRVLNDGGVWVSLEAKNGVPLFSNDEYRDLMPWKMRELGMKNTVSEKEWLYWMGEYYFPVVYRKEPVE